ncbi:hypothetical protein [Halostreptopolyspora alba]
MADAAPLWATGLGGASGGVETASAAPVAGADVNRRVRAGVRRLAE